MVAERAQRYANRQKHQFDNKCAAFRNRTANTHNTGQREYFQRTLSAEQDLDVLAVATVGDS